MPLVFYIAWRHLVQRWRQTLMSTLTVAVGVAILNTALALTNGFEDELVSKILGTAPHVTMTPIFGNQLNAEPLYARIEKIPGIKRVSPLIKGQALITDGNEGTGALIHGIDPIREADWKRYLTEGSLAPSSLGGIVLGEELARKHGWDLGHELQVIIGPNQMAILKVTGFFSAGLYELDSRVAFLNMPQAQALFQLGTGVNGLNIKLDDPFQAPQVTQTLRTQVPELISRDWMANNHSLIGAMALEKKVIFLVMLFIIVVALLGIANTLVMIVMEKTADISIMRAVGATRNQIAGIFLLEGLAIGAVGVLFGCLGGWGLSELLHVYPVPLPSDVYTIEKLPVKREIGDFLAVGLATMVICFLASLVPARRATRMDPIETLRKSA